MQASFARRLSYWLNWPLVPPSKLILLLTHRCPVACEFCSTHRWAEARPRELTLAELEARLAEAAEWGIREVLFSGGEPLLRRSDLLALTRAARGRGMIPTLITSGAVGGRATLEALVDAGMASFMVSIDGDCVDTHDRLRGRRGSFDEAIAWIAGAVELRRALDAPSPPFTVYVQTVVTRDNVRELVSLARRIRELGADAILFQGLAPDAYLAAHGFDAGDLRALADAIEQLARIEPRSFVMNPDGYLHELLAFYGERERIAPKRCPAGFDTLVLAPDGSVSTCRESFTRDIRGADGEPLSLHQAWTHRRFQAARRTMRVCQEPCTINCWYSS